MKNAELMTPEELRRLANEKEQEYGRIVKRAVLKHDLYESLEGKEYQPSYDFGDWLITEEQRDKLIDDFKRDLGLALRKGTPFVALKFDDGITWFDDINYGCEDRSEEWAQKHLENFEDVT